MKPWIPKCRHPQGGVIPCSYCGRRTCPACHLAEEHLSRCETTRTRETRGRRL